MFTSLEDLKRFLTTDVPKEILDSIGAHDLDYATLYSLLSDVPLADASFDTSDEKATGASNELEGNAKSSGKKTKKLSASKKTQ